MRLSILSLGLILVAGCDAADPPSAERAQSPEVAAEGVPPPADLPAREPGGERIGSSERLAGEYRVAGVGGQDIDLPYGITASISADRIHLTADCINLAWSYRFAQAMLATERVAVEGCGRGLTAEEEALAAALDGAEQVVRLPSGAYEVSGRGPSATLFTQ